MHLYIFISNIQYNIWNQRNKNINKLTNDIYIYINVCYNYHSIDHLINLLINVYV